MSAPTCEPLGDRALLLRWGRTADAELNARVHAVAAQLRREPPSWQLDLVPAYASLALFFDPAAIAGDAPLAHVTAHVQARLAAAAGAAGALPARLVRIPVHYGGDDGPDLEAVAAACGLRPAEVVARHAAPEYRVAMLGFAPGFPYLLGLDPALATPRLPTPRARVAAGSVGIGGAQTGLYPAAGPGGWRLIGRTSRTLFDADRPEPSLLLPGDRLRFEPAATADLAPAPGGAPAGSEPVPPADAALEVLAGGLQTTVQDLGRVGSRHLGVGAAGALDAMALQVGNLLVGNPPAAAGLEITLHGPRLRLMAPARIAITGAEIDARADGVALPGDRPIRLPAGCELVFGACRRGARAYVAFAGGLAVAPCLGSAATDLRGGFGGLAGRALAAGDRLGLGAGDASGRDRVSPPGAATPTTEAIDIARWWLAPAAAIAEGREVVVRVLPGHDALAPAGALCAGTWRVAAQSNRQGLRLQGPALAPADTGERVSEPVAPGTVQLPADGQPIVLLADAQTIGGYPRIAHVIAADLPRLAQLRPGDTLRFAAIDAAAAAALDCAQRRRLSRIGLALDQRRRMDARNPPP